MSTSLGNMTLDEYEKQLELNEMSKIKRAAFEVAYRSIVDKVLAYFNSDDEELPEEFIAGPAWEIYQNEIKRLSSQKPVKSLEKPLIKSVERRKAQQLAHASGDISQTPSTGLKLDLTTGEG